MKVMVSRTCDGRKIHVKATGLGSFFVSMSTEPFAALVKDDVAEDCCGTTFYPWHTMEMDRDAFLRELHAEHRRADTAQAHSSGIDAAHVAFAEKLAAE